MRPLNIEGAWLATPVIHQDPRGLFLELYSQGAFAAAVGVQFEVLRASLSVSAKQVVRGIHYSVPGQAKYISCVAGAIVDVVVDIRIGSPTFGQTEMVQLDDDARQALYVPGDLAHGFCALTDNATVLYLQSTLYRPADERALNPMDPALGINWPSNLPQLSQRDLGAPALIEARNRGLLPTYGASHEA
jgi:dTDP-4-dehydrorhamnose 3,5-epimerase